MSGKRLTGILLAVGLLVLLGGLLLLALDDGAPPPRPAAEVPAPAAPQPVAASPAQPSPSWVPLAAMATIDEFVPEAPADRDARLQLVEGMFRASGLEIRPDGSTRYEKLGQPQLALTTRIAEIAVYRGEEKVRTLPLNPAPGREVANERRTGSITFQDLAPGLDLQLAYDGRSIKELLTLQPKLVSELLAGGGDTLRIGYRFDEIRRDPGEPPPEWRSSPWGEPLASGKIHPEQHLHLGRPGQTDFELPPAWADGGAGGKLFLDRILDLTDREHPLLGVELPLEYLKGAPGTVVIDPTLVDPRASVESTSTGEAIARGPDGTLHVLYRKSIQDPNDGRRRWSIVWAEGKGATWALRGIVAPVIAAATDQGADQHHPTIAITSDGTIHAAWQEVHRCEHSTPGCNPDLSYYDRYMIAHAYKRPGADSFISTGFVARDRSALIEQQHPALAVDEHDNVYLFYDTSSGNRYHLWHWDPQGVTEADQPPAPVGAGGTKKVAGAWFHVNTVNNGCAHSEVNLEVDAQDRLHVVATRCRPGPSVLIATPTNMHSLLPGIPRPSQITWSWSATRFVHNNDPGAGGSNHWVLFAPNKSASADPLQVYTYGDPGIDAERDPYIWRHMDYSTTPPTLKPGGETCFEHYYNLGDLKVAVELTNPTHANADNGDFFYVSRLQMHTYFSRSPYRCFNGRGFEEWHFRTYFARYDATDGKWKDQTWVFGPNEPETNRFQEHYPKVAYSPDGSVHVVAYQESNPFAIIYRKRNRDGSWEGYRQLNPSPDYKYGVALRSSNYPRGSNECYMECTPACQTARACGNRVDSSGLDLIYTSDGNKIVYLSTGRPDLGPRLLQPSSHTFVKTTTPTLVWEPISTDRPDLAQDVCYKVEIARSVLFDSGSLVYVKPDGDPAEMNQFVCTTSLTVGNGGVWKNGNASLGSGQAYYWRVTAKNAGGLGQPSTPFELGVDTTAPGAFSLNKPDNNSAINTRTPTFEWTASSP